MKFDSQGRFVVAVQVADHAELHVPGGGDEIDWDGLIHMSGTTAARPAAGATNNGALYFATDADGGTLYRSNGSVWSQWASSLSHTHTFASLTSKPTTIAGYGITDAYTKSEVYTQTEVDTLLAAIDVVALLSAHVDSTGAFGEIELDFTGGYPYLAGNVRVNSIGNAHLATVGDATIKGRQVGTPGDVEDLTADQVAAILDTATDPIVRASDLGTIASQDASSVAITGGSVTGITDIAVADGGTGASTANLARKNINQGTVALTDGANIATDAALGNVFTVTLGGNRTLDNPTNLVAGATYLWIISQDGAGGRTLAFGTTFTFPGGTDPTLSTGANDVDVISGVYDGTKLRCVASLDFS